MKKPTTSSIYMHAVSAVKACQYSVRLCLLNGATHCVGDKRTLNSEGALLTVEADPEGVLFINFPQNTPTFKLNHPFFPLFKPKGGSFEPKEPLDIRYCTVWSPCIHLAL